MTKRPIVLIIRDGWGINPGGREKAEQNGDATMLASTPFHDHLYATYPQATLSASGMDVGLPEGQMGNSEVGHMNLGAGRIVYQDLTRINKAIADGELKSNKVLQEAFAKARGQVALSWSGLDGGVHSHQNHLIALTKAAKEAGVDDIMIHAITDGRDTSPTGAADYLATIAAQTARADRTSSRLSAATTPWIVTNGGSATSLPGMRSSSDAVSNRIRLPQQRYPKPTRTSPAEMSSWSPLSSPIQTNSECATAMSSSGSIFGQIGRGSFRPPF